nr:MAG TPA: hypothetical protein [Bacteriophage sp.]
MVKYNPIKELFQAVSRNAGSYFIVRENIIM